MLHSIAVAAALCIVPATVASGLKNQGSFASPAALLRPRFRYWLPDASVSADTVKENIRSASSVGAGGVEFLPFYNYGGEIDGVPPGADWSTYNFGTPPFQELFRAALEAHHENGLLMDFALGPNQGQGVPARADDEGLQWDLVPASVIVPNGQDFSGILPGWGTGELVAAVSASILSETVVELNAPPSPFFVTADSYINVLAVNGTLQDHSDNVDATSGRLQVSFASTEGANHTRLFAFYQKLSGNHNLVPAKEDAQTIFEDGAYNVDHFSAQGAQTVAKFWEQYILTNGVQEMLSESGQCGWEDSMEILSNISWSKSLPDRFQAINGYDIRPYLPLIVFGNNNINIQGGNPGAYRVRLNNEDGGMGYINDYRVALASGYQEYLTALVDWTQSALNLTFSSQVSYNMPMDMESFIPYVDIPECESLQFRDSVDGYRQFSATAYLAGRNVVSIELGAVFGQAYRFTLPDLLFAANRAFAGGVNRHVIHGQSYTGNYTATTWPGYTTFGYQVSEQYSDKQPSWDHGLQAVMDYMSRTSWVQQRGVGKIDLAFYNRQSATDPTVGTIFADTDLAEAGWTYGYISPANFKLPGATVEGGILAPNGPAFKAMIVMNNQNMTLIAASDLQAYADAGLPIILLGGEPGYYPSRDGRDEEAVRSAVSQLAASSNVYQVAKGSLLSTLQQLGLVPNVASQTNGTLWTTWREDEDRGIDYAFAFADTNSTSGDIVVQTTKTPYTFNAWTGEQQPIVEYTVDGNQTTIPINLAGNQTLIIAFSSEPLNDKLTPQYHGKDQVSNAIGYQCSSEGNVVAHVPGTPLELKQWSLTAEHWEAPSNIDDASVVAVKRNTTHQLDSLISWTEIPTLVNASGVGYYETTLTWPPQGANTTDLGAYIEFTPVLHAITLYVNGQRTQALDYLKPVMDISSYLEQGPNTIQAVVPTTMLNYLGSIQGEIRNAGANVTIMGKTDNGLVGSAYVRPYNSVPL